MAIIQTSDQVRYLRRKNLEEEARIIGNYYSDVVAMYGIDCIYHKMNTSEFTDFKTVIDENTILKRAYGYNITPTYQLSVATITFAEVDNDIFNLNKIGYTPNTDITLVFDSTKFACDLAPRIGRYREYKIKEDDIICEVPPYDNTITSFIDDDGNVISGYVSSDVWPYEIGLGYAETFRCEAMHGHMRCLLSGYQVGVEQTVMCDPYEHVDFDISFPKNEDLYYSLKHTIQNDDYLETMLYLTFTVDKVAVGNNEYKYILHGKTHGSVLFFDLDYLGKYTEHIHPDIGDIIEIDFPDENNREKYEITDCFDKQLTQDGINPLLHKYVWKCKARRYINSYEEGVPPDNEADKRLVERNNYETVVQEQVAKEVSLYDDIDAEKGIKQDAVYGGYDGVVENYDKQETTINHMKYDFIEGMQCIDIMRFECGSRITTDGYQLIFVTRDFDSYIIAQSDKKPTVGMCTFECGTRWLKATDSSVIFVNIEGDSFILATDVDVTNIQHEIALDDTHQSTVQPGKNINKNGDSFVKFDGTRTVLFATPNSLYAKLSSNNKTYQLI